jgi:hypothetical protein
MDILRSASKIVLLITACAVVGLTAVGKVDPKDFVQLATIVFMYYFQSNKPSGSPGTL